MSNLEESSWPPKPTLPEPDSRPVHSRVWLVRASCCALPIVAVNAYNLVNAYRLGIHSNQASQLSLEQHTSVIALLSAAVAGIFVWMFWYGEKIARQKNTL